MTTVEHHQSVPIAPGRVAGVGHLLKLVRDPVGLLQSARAAGDIARIFIGPAPVYVINSPDLIYRMLVSEATKFNKGRLFDRATFFFGNGLLTSDGDFHLRQRRMVQPAFRGEYIAGWVGDITRAANARIEEWRTGKRIDVLAEMQDLALDIAVDTLLATDLSPETRNKVHHASPLVVKGVITQMAYPNWIPPWLPIPGNRKFHRACADLRSVFDEVLASIHAGASRGVDIFSLLCGAGDEETGSHMDDTQVKDEAVTILVAATETTATTLGWLCYELGRDPELQQRVREQVVEVAGDRAVTYADLAKLTLLDHVVSETLRRHTPNWLLMRRTIEETDLDGFVLPKNADIVYSPTTLHRDPDLYPNPMNFDPSRWENVRPHALRTFIPFGAGRRKCIGDGFARTELMASAATLLQRRRLVLPPDVRVRETKLMGTLQPSGLRMVTEELP